jgi:hypothetical protein
VFTPPFIINCFAKEINIWTFFWEAKQLIMSFGVYLFAAPSQEASG